jgi:hypothetical protein
LTEYKIKEYTFRMKKIIMVICFVFIAELIFADDIKQPTGPKAPVGPARPVVSGNSENTGFPKLPPFPAPPDVGNQSNEQVREIEKYNLVVSQVLPNGDTRNNVANTINNAQYILYSDRTMTLKLFFKNGSEYIYYLKNPRSKIEISAGVFRETFDVLVQVDRKFLLEQYIGELSYNDNTVTSLSLIGNNKVITVLRFSKKV